MQPPFVLELLVQLALLAPVVLLQHLGLLELAVRLVARLWMLAVPWGLGLGP